MELGTNIVVSILLGLNEQLPEIIDTLVDMIPVIVDTLVDNLPLIVSASIVLFSGLVSAIPKVIPKLIDAIPDLISGAITTLLDSLPMILETGVKLFMQIVNAIPKIIPKLISGLGKIVSTVIHHLVDKLKSVMKFDWHLPKLKLPHLTIDGEFSIAPPKVPHFGISWYAKGGVFDSTTLFPFGNGSIGGLGEDGAEAVVPLEKNTQWLDRIAERLQGDNTPVVLMVDGKVFGEMAVNSINGITKQRGYLPLQFA